MPNLIHDSSTLPNLIHESFTLSSWNWTGYVTFTEGRILRDWYKKWRIHELWISHARVPIYVITINSSQNIIERVIRNKLFRRITMPVVSRDYFSLITRSRSLVSMCFVSLVFDGIWVSFFLLLKLLLHCWLRWSFVSYVLAVLFYRFVTCLFFNCVLWYSKRPISSDCLLCFSISLLVSIRTANLLS